MELPSKVFGFGVFLGAYVIYNLYLVIVNNNDRFSMYVTGLKVRLEERGDLEVEDFEVIAPSVWNQLKRCKNVEFYVLPRTRPDLIKYKWLDFKDDRGTYFEPVRIEYFY